MKFKPYGQYKASGVEWLGNVPDEWQVLPLFTVLHERQTKNEGNHVANVLSLSYGRIVDRNIESNHGLLPASFETYQIVEQDDIILRLTDLQNDQRSLRVGQVHRRGIITSAYTCLIPSEGIDPYYAYLLLHAYDTLKIFYGLGGGVRQSMKFDDLKRLPIALPPRDEQSALATFLSCETAKIDALIAKQKNLIDLLKEKRQALVSHAVTKGIDSNVLMKSSGVEWLGNVPEHWEVSGFTKYLGPIIDYRGRTPTKTEDGVVLLTARNVKNGKINYEASEEFISPDEYSVVMQRGLPQIGDVIFTMEAPLGQVANIDRAGIALAQRIVKFSGSPGFVNNYFLKYWIMGTGCQVQLEQLATGSTALGIKSSKLGQIKSCWPPIEEQERIVSYVDAALLKIDKLISQAEHATVLQREHRTALISAAVTGKIDVREVKLELKQAA